MLSYKLGIVLQVGDQLVEINGYCTQSMSHAQAIDLIQSGGSTVRVFIRRTNNPNPLLGKWLILNPHSVSRYPPRSIMDTNHIIA